MPDRRLVALRLPPGAETARAIRQAWDAGEAVCPLDPALPAPELERVLAEVRPHALVEPEGTTALDQGLPVRADSALIVVTSGTTGAPKAVELSHRALRASASATWGRIGREPGDRWLCCLPLWHVAGIMTLVRSVDVGADPLVHDGFDVAAVTAAGANLISLVPTMLHRLVEAGSDLSRWRVILLGGAPVSRGLLERATKAGANIVVTYGMTEMCGGVVYDGIPLDGVDVSFDEEEKILLRGPMMMEGYRNRPEATAEAMRGGWFHTNDVGAIDAHDRLVVHGRADDIVITGGEKVHPGEIEMIVSEHPEVHEVMVVGEPDDEWGQRLVAYVVPAASGAPNLDDLRRFVREHAAPHKAPQALIVVDELPARR